MPRENTKKLQQNMKKTQTKQLPTNQQQQKMNQTYGDIGRERQVSVSSNEM